MSSGGSPFRVAPSLPTSSPFREPPTRVRTPWSRLFGSFLVTVSVCALSYSVWETTISSWMASRAQSRLAQEFAEAMAATAPGPTVTDPDRIEVVRVGGVSTPLRLDDQEASTSATVEFGDTAAESDGLVERPDPTPVPESSGVVSAVGESVAEIRSIPQLPANGELVGRVIIDAIGVDWFVQAGTSSSVLRSGPGVWEHGSFPGAPGNATLSAHRTTYGGPFRRLDQLQLGDRIVFQAPGRPDAVFEVRGWDRVTPRDVQVTYPVEGVRLTLLTCDPPGSTAKRLVVQAELVEGEFVDQALPEDRWTFLR